MVNLTLRILILFIYFFAGNARKTSIDHTKIDKTKSKKQANMPENCI